MGNKQIKSLREKEVEKIAVEREKIRALSVRPPAAAEDEQDKEEKDLQAQVCAVDAERRAAAVAIQAWVRGFLGRRYYLQVRKRTPIARELWATEKSYLEALQTLLNCYMSPLLGEVRGEREKHARTGVTENQVKTVFGCVEVLYNINNELFGQLSLVLAQMHHDTCIGSIFLASVEYLRSYIQFVNNYNTALDVIRGWRSDDASQQILVRLDAATRGGSLEMYLITPIQRIPRYVLLLRDLCRNTPTSHPDYVDLAVACEKMEELASLVNRRKLESDRSRDVMRIQAEIYPALAIDLVAPHRQLLVECDAEQVVPKFPSAAYITPIATPSFSRPLSNKVTDKITGKIRFSSFNPSRSSRRDSSSSSSSSSSSRRNSKAKPVDSSSDSSSSTSSSTSPNWNSVAYRVLLFNDLFLCCKEKAIDSYKPKVAAATVSLAALLIDHPTHHIARVFTKPLPECFVSVLDMFLCFETAQQASDFVTQLNVASDKQSPAVGPAVPPPESTPSSPLIPLASFAITPTTSISFAPSQPISQPISQPFPSSSSEMQQPIAASPLSDSELSPCRSMETVSREGYIQKKGHVRHNWKTRFLKLEADSVGPSALSYFHDDQASRPKGKILLMRPMHVAPTKHDTRKYCFSVFSDDESNVPLLTISVASQSELKAWIDAIEEAIDSFDES
ncbi:MAG: hypothetical protein Q8P67_24130 [archaeon]|nr:hypothetical protein [archaeon]